MNTYCIKIDDFEGPLDLLLHLVKQSNIDIYNINLNEITNQYFEYIHKWEKLNIDIASEYLVMAATLIEIKSKSLLPNDKTPEEIEDPEEASRENLIQKLVDYQRYKEITKNFKELEDSRRQIYTKAPSKLNEMLDQKITNDGSVTIDDLMAAFTQFLARKNLEKPIHTRVTNKEYSVRKRKESIKNYLQQKKQAEFTELFDIYSKSYIVVTFMSVLELTKESIITITQEDSFDKIYLKLKV